MPEDPQVVLVTGARKGIGRALAEHFLEQGALVEGCSRREADWSHDNYRHHLADVADEVRSAGWSTTSANATSAWM